MHGTTLEETEQILVEAVETYLEEVDRLPEQDRDRLLKRHSPWTLRLSLKVLSLMSRLKRKFGYRGFSFTLSIKTQYTGIISKKLITGT
ncbi:MAG: hypothetical protein OXC91_06060 [Rhodobacteraceae bacterium]|nr:hypothetical protein [Paracoccaceae bacterium]